MREERIVLEDHSHAPLHGGVVTEVGDMDYELVAQPERIDPVSDAWMARLQALVAREKGAPCPQ